MKRLIETTGSTLVLMIFVLTGCSTIDSIGGRGAALAQVDVPFKGDVTTVKCTASLNQNCKNGISHLRNRDWQLAVEELEKAVAQNPRDIKAQFALGVACEMLNDLHKAIAHYKAANFISGDMEHMRAVDRVDFKLKSLAGK